MGFINDNIKAARKRSGMNQIDAGKRLGVPQSTWSTWEKKGRPDDDSLASIAKLFGYSYNQIIDEDFIIKNQLSEDATKYKVKRKKLADVKEVDSASLQVTDAIQIKAMLRVLLRTQATLIAKEEKIAVSDALKKMSEAVRAETSEEFDEL